MSAVALLSMFAISSGCTRMVDVVDVLRAFEAKRTRGAKPVFEIEQWAIGGAYYACATLPDRTIDRVEGFVTEEEAGQSIRNGSVVWLHSRKAS
jgi:hypothetical protein